jgi:hypothetical protein
MSAANNVNHLVRVMRSIRSEDGENPEYDRALHELLAEVLGTSRSAAKQVLDHTYMTEGE